MFSTLKSSIFEEMDKYRVYCPVCLENYDFSKHVPLFHPRPGCGHSICRPCFEESRKNNDTCVICRTKFCRSDRCNPVNVPLLRVCSELEQMRRTNIYLRFLINTLESEAKKRNSVRVAMYGENRVVPCIVNCSMVEVEITLDINMAYEIEGKAFHDLVYENDPRAKNWQLYEAVENRCQMFVMHLELSGMVEKLKHEQGYNLVKNVPSRSAEAPANCCEKKHPTCGPSTSTAVPECMREFEAEKEEEEEEEDNEEEEEENEEEEDNEEEVEVEVEEEDEVEVEVEVEEEEAEAEAETEELENIQAERERNIQAISTIEFVLFYFPIFLCIIAFEILTDVLGLTSRNRGGARL